MGNLEFLKKKPIKKKWIDPPSEQLKNAIQEAGLEAPDTIELDGRLHRFFTGVGKRTDKTGWYVAYDGRIPAGAFGCWRELEKSNWRADVDFEPSQIDLDEIKKRTAEAIAKRDEETRQRQEAVSKSVGQIWEGMSPAANDHPYLVKKGVSVHGVKVSGDGRLAVPVYAPEGNISSLQYIDGEGEKRFHPGGKTGGCFSLIGDLDQKSPIFIAEGYATAATIYEETGRPCFVTFSAQNMKKVIEPIFDTVPNSKLVIVADHDESKTGERCAYEASSIVGCHVVMPPQVGDANDYRNAGGDIRQLLDVQEESWLVQGDEFCSQPAPIKWLVKGWLQQNALMMIHGPSGGGKTFAILDMSLRIATGQPSWNGAKVSHGSVVYLAGEGHHGLKSRLAAWKQHHSVESMDFWISKAGCDLNTRDGFSLVHKSLKSLPEPPSLVVVDTLHRFLDGDENSAQDAKGMIEACGNIMEEFGCAVILVHHTGTNENAQHRARGSSSWRGALDIEINVVPGEGSSPITIRQMKSKDSEMEKPAFVKLKGIKIDGWLDDEGQPVGSAVVVPSNSSESSHHKHLETFRRAWTDSGEKESDGCPYVSRDDLKKHLMDKQDMSETAAKKAIQPGSVGRLVCELLKAEEIKRDDALGFILIGTHAKSNFKLLRTNGQSADK